MGKLDRKSVRKSSCGKYEKIQEKLEKTAKNEMKRRNLKLKEAHDRKE